jgi:hypothetical protein
MKSEELFKELQFIMTKPALLEAVESVANYSGTLTATAAEIIRQAVLRVGNTETYKQQGQPFVFAAKFYAQTIKEILSEFDWRFARQQAPSIAKDAANPPSGYSFRYPVPAGAIKIIRVNGIDAAENFGEWEEVGNFIHTNATTPINADYIAPPANDADYPAIFIEMVVSRLAYKLAMAMGLADQAVAAAKEMEFLIQRPAILRETGKVAAGNSASQITTKSQICKQAIMRLGDTETLKGQPMVFANSFYEHTLEELLSDVPWAFAKKQATLAKDAINPGQGYLARYALPVDFIQLIRVENIDTTENLGQWEIVGGYLHTDLGASTAGNPVKIDYTANQTDVTKFPAPFIEALIARIAAKIAMPLTGNGEVANAMATVAVETMARPSVRILIEKSAKPRATSAANSVSEICRQAILRVGSADAFQPYGEPMAIATSLYEQTRNEVLSDYDWQFARVQSQLTAHSTPPSFGYTKRYALPSGTLKVLRVNGVDEDENFGKWEIVAGYLHTNDPSPVQVESIGIIADVTQYPPVFVNMLIVTLAMKLAQLLEIGAARAVQATK